MSVICADMVIISIFRAAFLGFSLFVLFLNQPPGKLQNPSRGAAPAPLYGAVQGGGGGWLFAVSAFFTDPVGHLQDRPLVGDAPAVTT